LSERLKPGAREHQRDHACRETKLYKIGRTEADRIMERQKRAEDMKQVHEPLPFLQVRGREVNLGA
jgi:hypothetical protein